MELSLFIKGERRCKIGGYCYFSPLRVSFIRDHKNLVQYPGNNTSIPGHSTRLYAIICGNTLFSILFASVREGIEVNYALNQLSITDKKKHIYLILFA